ncbi:MAG: hypothetical protein D6732_06460 [Methanobacteriota archaeon]|nr:MAG: hypothetical protein D6732_06460 [Euryarchaeota archaeon]
MKVQYVLLILLLASSLIPASGQEVEDKYVILFDQSHGQYFTLDMMKTAFESLSALEDRYGTEIVVRPLNDKFNSTNLQGADLVIISNPESGGFALTEEKRALADFVEAGGSTLYMGNPYSEDKNITGNPSLLNDMMSSNFQTKAAFQTAQDSTTDPTVVVDDFNNDGNFTHVIVTPDNLDAEVVYKGPVPGFTNVSEVLYYGSAVIDKDEVSSLFKKIIHGNFSETAYAVDAQFDPAVLSQEFFWLVGKEYENGRSMAVGSTIMFSDLPYDNNTKWIDQKDNLKLFQNLIAWLLQITPAKEEKPIIEQAFSFFVSLDIGVAIGLTVLFLLMVFSYLIINGKLSPSEITNVGLGHSKITKEQLASQKKVQKKTATPTSSKRKKRKRGQVK